MRCGVLLGMVMALATASATSRAAVLERIDVLAGAPTRVELTVSGPVVPWARRLAATPQSPARIYVDLPDTVLGPRVPRLTPCRAVGLTRIRTGQFTPTTARIVLDATADVAFAVHTSERRVVVTLGAASPPPGRPAAAVAPPIPAPAAEAPPLAPSPATAATEPRLPLIVVDAGHGGHDPGAKGIGGVVEKTVVLQIAHRLAAKLPALLPVDSLLTRSDDSFVPLAERLVRRSTGDTVFVSLHANACAAAEPKGLEIFFGGPGDARRLARLVTQSLRTRLIRVRGQPRPGPFTVLTANPAPSVLVELGYLTHPRDAARLQDPRYQELLTDALVDAIAAFLQSSPVQTVQNHHG